MNRLLSISIICCAFLSACSNPAKQQKTVLVAAKSPEKHTGHQHRPLANGILSLDIINYQNKLHILTGSHHDGKKALWYQNSSDQGVSWSSPVNINNSQHIEANLSRGNDARLAVQGDNIVAIWASRVEGAPHNAGPMKSAHSTDGGKTWLPSIIPADWTIGPHAFFAMAGNNDSINAVWLDSRHGKSSVSGSQGLRFSQSTDGGQSWSTNKTLDNITCACCWNTAKFDSNNNFYVLYRDKQPTDMALGVLNKKQQWQRLSTVGAFNWDFPGCPHIGGGLAIQEQDHLIHSVIGSGHIDYLGVHYLRSKDNGKSWSDPVQLGDENAVHSDIAAHNNGKVVAVWDMRTEDGLSIFYAESLDKGSNWSKAKRLSQSGMRGTHPRIITTQTGFLVLWTESATGKIQTLKMKAL